MPIYEYVCEGCDNRFERYLRTSGETVSCPACQSPRVEKQPSSFAFAGTNGAGSGSSCGGCKPGPSCSSCHR